MGKSSRKTRLTPEAKAARTAAWATVEEHVAGMRDHADNSHLFTYHERMHTHALSEWRRVIRETSTAPAPTLATGTAIIDLDTDVRRELGLRTWLAVGATGNTVTAQGYIQREDGYPIACGAHNTEAEARLAVTERVLDIIATREGFRAA